MARCESCMTNPVHPDKKCCFNCARVNTNCEVWHNCGEDCPGWDSKVKTNGDWIRSMSDKELAEFLGHSNLCVRIQHSSTWCEEHGSCDGCLEEWLQQPVEVE